MGRRAYCPGCDSETSTVLRGLEEEGKCPYCGLPAEVIAAVQAARERNADEAILKRLMVAEQRVSELETENHNLKTTIQNVRYALTDE